MSEVILTPLLKRFHKTVKAKILKIEYVRSEMNHRISRVAELILGVISAMTPTQKVHKGPEPKLTYSDFNISEIWLPNVHTEIQNGL